MIASKDVTFPTDLDDDDDRTWPEWFGDTFFNPICWIMVGSIALGIAGLSFFAGIWGFVHGIALLR